MILIMIGLLFGIGFGFFVQRAGLCFAVGLGEIFMGRGKRITQMFLIVFIITVIGFFVLGLKPIGHIRGFGFYNLLSGLLFGAGIFMCGGCILGSLRQLGEGNLAYVVVVLSMIPGMALIVRIVNPILEKGYSIQKIVIPDLIPVAGWLIVVTLVIAASLTLGYITFRKNETN